MSEKILPSKKIREDISRGYNRDPRGWGAFVGRDDGGYISSIFTHKSNMWIIKEFAINPYRSLGCGIRTSVKDDFKSENYPFGLRSLTRRQEEELKNGNSSIIEEILNKNPISGKECNDSLVLEGPVIASDGPPVISNEQEKLDLMLRKSLNSLIHRKYPEFFKSYL